MQSHPSFPRLNRAYNTTFRFGRMSLGLVAPLEAYPSSPVPSMQSHVERVRLAEQLGFAAVWLRDVPFNVPSFGDAGQVYDPYAYLGFLAAHTHRIALGVASVVLPLRHPAHVAKAAASVDALSSGRLLLGVASGDRPDEYPAMALNYDSRGARFRESFDYIRAAHSAEPNITNGFGSLTAASELLPRRRVPMLVTGGSQQSPQWIAQHADGWLVYPRETQAQRVIVEGWRARVAHEAREPQPIVQPLYFDLRPQRHAPKRDIHLGFSSGVDALLAHLETLEAIGVNHVALNLRFNQLPIEDTLEVLAKSILPRFYFDDDTSIQVHEEVTE